MSLGLHNIQYRAHSRLANCQLWDAATAAGQGRAALLSHVLRSFVKFHSPTLLSPILAQPFNSIAKVIR